MLIMTDYFFDDVGPFLLDLSEIFRFRTFRVDCEEMYTTSDGSSNCGNGMLCCLKYSS
jgi:hypothetical protein